LSCVLALLPAGALAAAQITVEALFGGKAMIMVDGKRHTLSTGETSPEGVKLVDANSREATLEIDGAQKVYRPGSTISLNYARPEEVEEKVFANDRGMFLSYGTINGRTVEFLVDTGATSIAMNRSQAKRLGIRYRMTGDKGVVSTASEHVEAYRVTLRSVSIGRIRQDNVEAVVLDGNHPGPILLGMSFLGNLKVEKDGKTLTIRQRKR
jgi:aspartyl protease family protein